MELQRKLADAIHSKTLGQVVDSVLSRNGLDLSEKEFSLVSRAGAVCANIRQLCEHHADLYSRDLRAAGIAHTVDLEEIKTTQIHQISVTVETDNPATAIAVARELGYQESSALTKTQWEVLRRTSDNVVLTRADDVTMRLRISWRVRLPGTWSRLLWPNYQDAGLIELPSRLWMFAFLLRPFALAKRKLWKTQRHANIGEFLGTPLELVAALLEFAGATESDVIYDLGCGDGRVLLEAANRYQCHAVGYEQDESLCERAISLAMQQGVSDFVTIHHADAMSAPIEKADIVFLFQPPSTVARILPALLQRLPPRGRIVAHEQSVLECAITPCESRPLFGESSLTVAHLWRADQADQLQRLKQGNSNV